MSTRQLAPTTIIRTILIIANCTFSAHDCNCFESNNQFHGCRVIKLWLLVIFILILNEHDCHAIMTWSFRLIVVMVVKVRCGARPAWQSCQHWQAQATAARTHWQ